MNEAKIGGPDCSICTGVCCTMARTFVEEAFGLGVTNLSPKVSLGIRYGFEVNILYVFRLLIKCYAMRTVMHRNYVKEVETGRDWGLLGLPRYVLCCEILI